MWNAIWIFVIGCAAVDSVIFFDKKLAALSSVFITTAIVIIAGFIRNLIKKRKNEANPH